MKLVIVDDDDIVLLSLKTIIEASGIEVVATGKSGNDAINLYEEFRPDILLSDIRMEGMTGIEAAYEITDKYKDAKILFLTTFSDDEYVINALKCNAKGYILKQDFEGIIPAIKAVYSGQSVFGGEIVSKLPSISADNENSRKDSSSQKGRSGSDIDNENVKENENDRQNRIKQEVYEEKDITEKEYEVIKLVAEGYNNKEIANKLYLSEGTVRNYVSSILDKLNLRDRTQLVVYYYKNV